MAMIELEDVHFKYTGRKAETLQGVSLHIHAGETVLILGASGSGKSTLALCLTGLIPQMLSGTLRGHLAVAGYDTVSTPLTELTQQIGIVFQDPEAQCITMTVEDEVAFGLENLCVPEAEMDERIAIALQHVGLAEQRHSAIDHLSGGGKQRLTVAALLAMRPRVLLFDEPTANLDPVGTQDVFEAIRRLKQAGTSTLLLIEHKLDTLMDLVDRVIVLAEGGKILLEGEPHQVFRDHITTLLEQGIWIPQVALLAHCLRERGWLWNPFPITLDEAVAAWKQFPKETGVSSVPTSSVPSTTSIHAYAEPKLSLEVCHLSYCVGTQKILDDLSFSVPQGDFLAIVGANGAGKTTLAHHLVGLLHPPHGRIFFNSHDITRLSSAEIRQDVGFVFQNPEHQFITGTVEEEVGFGLREQRLPEEVVAHKVRHLLEQFGLSRYARANPFTLSHGEKRRLSVASMLVRGQSLLILDEPTFGQDQRNATSLLERMKALNEYGQTIIMITHDMSLVAAYAHHVVVLEQGRLLYHGLTRQLFAQPELLQRAHLSLPPLAQLSQRLAAVYHVSWQHLLTLEQFLQIPALQQMGEG